MAIQYTTHTSIEKKPSFMGISLQDLLIATSTFIVFLLLGAVFIVIGLTVGYYFIAVLAAYLASLIFLFHLTKSGHPDFLVAFISFKIIQFKKIDHSSLPFSHLLPIKTKFKHD